MFFLPFLALCVLPSFVLSFIELQVRCKETSLALVRYLSVTWPPLAGYKSLELRITAFHGPVLHCIAEENHESDSTNAALAFTGSAEGVDVTLWGEVTNGWVLVSLVHWVTACRQYQQ
jgi:hypothetical protein